VDWREDNPKNENNAKNRESKAYREKLYEEENESLAELTGAYDGDLGDIFLDFKISDTGLGVKEERIDNFFDIDDSYERSDIGMFKVSLGLAIARELVRMLGGDVSVESIYGAGTTVRFSVRQSVFDYSYVNYNERKRREMARRDSNSHLCLPDVKILIVDDSEIALQVEKALFETYEITCDVATSGFDALDKIMVNHYDMAFVSTVLPVMDGIDTVREIRNLEGEEFKKMPIVALSANLVDTSREEILTSGFNELIVKPIELDQAEAMLRSFISQDKIKEKDNDITELEGENKFIEDAEILSGFVNVEEAIKVMGGSFKIFNTFISNYKEEYQTEVQLLKSYVDEDVRRYKNIIHDIKSSSSNIGAYGVERKAANLESAINIGNQQYVRDNTRDFVAMMNDFFKRIDVYMARISHVELPDKKETRDKINKGKLKELRAFLRQNEITPAKEILADIDRYEYGDIDMEFLAALKDFVSSGDYEASSEMIDQYLNSI
jgi:CheY-like chemotaxis protein